MRKIQSLLIVPVITVWLFSCMSGKKEAPAFDMAKARSFIDSINTKFSEEFKKGDSVAVASHYGSDAALMLPKMEPLKGKAILSLWSAYINSSMKESAMDL